MREELDELEGARDPVGRDAVGQPLDRAPPKTIRPDVGVEPADAVEDTFAGAVRPDQGRERAGLRHTDSVSARRPSNSR